MFLNKATINTTAAAASVLTGSADAVPVEPPAPKKKQAKLTSFLKKVENEPVVSAAAVTSPAAAPTDALLQLQRVSFDFEDDTRRFGGEGRTITVELDKAIVVACYVPNSGEGLVRLDYRVDQW